MSTPEVAIDEPLFYPEQYWLDAERHYKKALKPLEKAWQQNKDDLSLFLSWVDGMHQLARVYQHRSDNGKAFHHLLTPHNWLVNKLYDKTLTDDEKATTLNAMRITFPPLYAYSQKHPCCENCSRTLEDTQAWFKQSAKKLH